MSELSIFLKAVKNAFRGRKEQDPSIVINRDGSVRINLESPEGRARVIQAAKSIQHIHPTSAQKTR
ncbi:hypothetical protein [Pusillimonas noertemannii]|uniref:Uncharacterized protein n=1 Tax=Pusillimonas noertemannii TaxID=305977 RepID=A0A2U1CPP1_9BURK|nr:hypothetical protein [Pusillimonas noertemannii]NYT67172.1 hypothetical protein [Pusillimonas noertemannii]PVY67849.1 hypothetical protein C7440_0232 [Pusillimonas noertemannii]TFL12626.1 hypothetical protein CSC72_05900 [Pusillimonas noertemannii]